MAKIPQNLGNKVSTRTIPWEDQVVKAWGSEFRTPDHGIYEFSNGTKKDSTDKYKTGIYGVVGDALLLQDGTAHPDMRDGLLAAVGAGASGAAINGYGNFEELNADNWPSKLTGGIVGLHPVPAFTMATPSLDSTTILLIQNVPYILDVSASVTPLVITNVAPNYTNTLNGFPSMYFSGGTNCGINFASFNLTTTWSNDFWGYMVPGQAVTFINNTTSLTHNGWTIASDTLGNVTFSLNLGGTVYASSSFAVSTGAWHHYELTVNGTSAYCFIDGVLKQTLAVPNTAMVVGDPTAIGNSSGGTSPSLCYISNFRIKNVPNHTAAFTPPQPVFSPYGTTYGTPQSTPVSGVVGLTVKFADASRPSWKVNGWSWTFGNGSTGNVQNPAPTQYTAIGSYNATLGITDTYGGNENTALTGAVVIGPPPLSNFQFYPPWGNTASGTPTYSNGNLTVSMTMNSIGETISSRMFAGMVGKTYLEWHIDSDGIQAPFPMICPTGAIGGSVNIGYTAGNYGLNRSGGSGLTPGYYNNAVVTGNGAVTWTAGDVIMMAFDTSTGNLWWGKNGTWFQGNPATATSPCGTALTSTLYAPAFGNYSGGVAGGTEQVTARVTLASLTYAPPTGYSTYSGQ